MTTHQGLPVHGYRDQHEANIAMVNCNKQIEESALRVLDALARDNSVDQEWLAEGRKHIEIGFMLVNRSIFRPSRVALPGDETTS
jgi:hypothetical protein